MKASSKGCAKAWLAKMAPLIDAEGFEWAVCGALAMRLHGFARETSDVDILVHDADRRILQLFRDHDAPSGMYGSAFARVHTGCPRGQHLDVTFAWFPLLETALAHRERQALDGVAVPVVPLAYLATWKALSESPKDGADLESLLRAGGVQVDSVETLLPPALPETASPYVMRHRNVQLAQQRLLEFGHAPKG